MLVGNGTIYTKKVKYMKQKEYKEIWGSEEPEDVFRIEIPEKKIVTEWNIPSIQVAFLMNGEPLETKDKTIIGKISVSTFMTNMLRKLGIKTCTLMVDGKVLLQKDASMVYFDNIETIDIVTDKSKLKSESVSKPKEIQEKEEQTKTKNHIHAGIVGYHDKINKHSNPEAQKAHRRAVVEEQK